MSGPNSAVSSRFGSKESAWPPAATQVLDRQISAMTAMTTKTQDSDVILPTVPPSGLSSRQIMRKPSISSSMDADSDAGSQNSGGGSLKASRTLSNARSIVKKGALGAGWAKLRLAGDVEKPPYTLERASADEISSFAMSQINGMYAHMEQVMSRERTRHSSDVHLLMRKVDKDLKETFKSVRATFVSLTQQVQELLREVDVGKKAIASIQDKFDAAKASAAIRAQYVDELEAVLDGQVPNISEAMRKLSEDVTTAKLNADKADKEASEKEQAMNKERANLQAVIKSLEERLNEKEVLGFAGATELPLLPEMSATWTRRQQRPDTTGSAYGSEADFYAGSDGNGFSPPGSANPSVVLSTTMAQSDSTRAVTRMKVVRPLARRPSTTPASPRTKQWSSRIMTRAQQQQLEAKVVEFKERTFDAEQRLARQHTLFLDSAPSLQLLREIFSELRENWRLKLPDADANAHMDVEKLREELAQVSKAPEILDRITQLFVENFKQLGSFSTVLDALCEEALRPAPQLSEVVKNLEVSGSNWVSEADDGMSMDSGRDLSPVADNDSGTGDEQVLPHDI